MDDEADVRLVNAHAEGNGGHYDVYLFHQELVLILRPCFGVQAGVVRQRLDTVDGEHLGHFLHLLAAETVDDAALAGILADETDNVLLRLHLIPYFIIKVGPIKGRLEHGGILDAEVLEDIALHLGGGGGRKGNDGSQLDFLYDGADFPVFRAEIVPPFGNTVGLVYGVEGYLYLPQEGYIFFFGEGFRRHIKQFGNAPAEVFLDLRKLDAAKGGIEEVGNAAVSGLKAPDCVYLVLHEGDERRDNNGRSFHDEGGQLIAQGLASTGGHEDKSIVALNEMRDDFLLVTFKRVVTKESLQFLV